MANGLAGYTDYYDETTGQPLKRLVVRPEVAATVESGSANSLGPAETGEGNPFGDFLSRLSEALGKSSDNLLGLNGKERYQLWPERLVREGLSAAHDVMSGEKPNWSIDPVTGEAHTSPQMIEAGQAMSALAGTGGLGGAGAEAGTALGSGPFLRPALKYGEKLYKGKEGQQHLDLIPADLYPTFQKQAMNGDDISHWNFGFYNDKGHFLTRDKALQYGIDNGIIDPQAGKFGALTSTMMSDSSQPAIGIQALKAADKPFYSAVENAVAGAKQNKADAQQWLSFLKNQPGVKQEELAHLGLDKLQGSVTKDDLLKAVQEGQPQIKEVVKGKVDENKVADLENKYAEAQKAYDKLDFNNLKLSEVMAQPETKNLNKAREELEAAKVIPTKYHSYQLPGGENYREMLLTLPDTSKAQSLRLEAEKRGYGDKISQWPDQEFANEYRKYVTNATDTGIYKSSHWDEPNVLAHIRMNDRNIDGKKTLHVEEIQSDWHQAGRKHGYKSDLNNLDETPKDYKDIIVGDQIKGWGKVNSIENTPNGPLFDIGGLKISPDKFTLDRVEPRSQTGLFSGVKANVVPDAPFKKTWDELAIKNVLDHAVKNGYDQVSWTPGEAQAARYDLSKQVDSIKYLKNDDGTYNMVPFKNNSPVHSIEKANIPADKLDDIVGKEVAEKIRNGSGDREKGSSDIRVLSGQDLKVGGEGMKAFYDKMLVDKFNALGKKYGAKVSKAELKAAPKYEVKNPILNKDGDEVVSVYKDGTFLADMKKSEADHYIESRKSKDKPVEAYTFPITPKLREQITTKGQPLFSAGLPIYTPVDYDPFKEQR